MSRSPRTTLEKASLDRYQQAWQATMQLLREGRSFSGHERNCVFLNCQRLPFANVSAVSGLDFLDDGRAVAVTDWDLDGDLDVWLGNRTGPRLRLMRNETVSKDITSYDNFVAFRLEGTASNRDAIGARVEVHLADPSAGRLIQTLYAGDAYLSQSSKWLHFGLGGKTQIQRVTVRWPNGQMEQFADVQAGRRYRLVEGSGKAADVTRLREPGSIKLIPSTQPTMPTNLTSRTFLSVRMPAPLLRYQPFDQQATKVVETRRRPLLLTFWASWCAPCMAELDALRGQAASLRRAGLDVLALSVDGLDADQRTRPEDASQLVRRLELPFPTAMATREMLDKLQVVERLVFNRQLPLAVPTSYLLDAEGAIAAVYRGPLQIPRLVVDVSKLDVPAAERRDLAVPLAGRWSSAPRELHLRAVAKIFGDGGHAEDYVRYLELDAESLWRQRERATSEERRTQLDDQFAAVNFAMGLSLASSGESRKAMQHFQRTIEVRPEHVEAHVNLGALMAKNGQAEQAITTLRRAVELAPGSAAARMNLGAALGSQGELGDAIQQYRQVLTIAPDSTKAHAQLALWLLDTGEQAEAAGHWEQAIRLNPRDVRSMLWLAWLRATSPDESIRDGAQAVRLAEQLESLSGGKDPRVLDVLSAAYAESGDYAAACQRSALALAQLKPDQRALRSAVQRRRESFEHGQPYRDEDGKYP